MSVTLLTFEVSNMAASRLFSAMFKSIPPKKGTTPLATWTKAQKSAQPPPGSDATLTTDQNQSKPAPHHQPHEDDEPP